MVKKASLNKRKKTAKSIDSKDQLPINTIKPKYAYLILFAIIAIVYGNNITFDYTYFDDDAIIIRNVDFISDFSNVFKAVVRDAEFQNKSVELYRPLQNVSFIIDAQIGQVSPRFSHFTNILIHFLSCVFLFLLLRKLNFSDRLSLFGAALLAVHPLFTFTVSWLPSRGDLLLALFGIASIFFYISYTKNKKVSYLVFHLITFLFAMFSKESAVFIIIICLLHSILFEEKFKLNKRHLIFAAAYLFVLIFYFYLRSLSIADIQSGNFGIKQFFGNFPVLPETILKFFIPVNIVALPFYNTGRIIGGSVIIIAILILIFWKKETLKFSIWSIVWFLGLTIPSMFYKPDWSDYIYDYVVHRSYLPMVGIIILCLHLINQLNKKLGVNLLTIVSVIILAVFSILSFSLAQNFKSPLAFWTYSVETNPKSAFAHNYLGNAYLMQNRHSRAIESYDKALEIKPDFKDAILNRGATKATTNDFTASIDDFNEVLKLAPEDTSALKFRAASFIQTKQFNEALKDLNKLTELGLKSQKIYYQSGYCYMFLKDYKNSEKYFELLLQKEPDNVTFLQLSGIANLQNGSYEKSIDKNKNILKHDTANVGALCNLAYSYWEIEDYDNAMINFQKAEKIETENLDAVLGLVLTYNSLNNKVEFEINKEKALKLLPILKYGESGIKNLEEQGFIFTKRQTERLKRIFSSN